MRQWKNTRHPDHIPITITFRDEETRFRVEEAALEGGLKGHRTPRDGDEEYDRIGFIRRSLSERERKELKIRRDKRNSPEGVAFAEIKKREDNSRTDQDDWTNFDVEGDEDPIIEIPANEYMETNMVPASNQQDENNNNNPIRGGAMAEEDLLKKMEELQNAVNRIRAEKDQATAEANRIAGAETVRQNREADAARRAEETENESNWDFYDPIVSKILTFRGNNGQDGAGPRSTASNFFAAEPALEYLEQPNLPKPEEGHPQANTPNQRGGESSDSECDYA